jgi:hypothetical protein
VKQQVVVKTRGQLPRRLDGLIRAGMRVGKAGGGSVGSVNGRASRCYLSHFGIRDGRFVVSGGPGPEASIGSKHVITVSAKDAPGQHRQRLEELHDQEAHRRRSLRRAGRVLGVAWAATR